MLIILVSLVICKSYLSMYTCNQRMIFPEVWQFDCPCLHSPKAENKKISRIIQNEPNTLPESLGFSPQRISPSGDCHSVFI